MTIQFIEDQTGKPDKQIRIPQAELLAEKLAQLLIDGAPPAMEFRQIAKAPASYQRYSPILQRLIRLSHKYQDVRQFFQELYDEYLQYNTPTLEKIWVKAVGYIVEHTFYLLMKMKYSSKRVSVMSEHRVLVPAPPVEASTKNNPIDVIMWCHSNNCGEFLEVKKNVDTKRGDPKFEAKVGVMYLFAINLESHFASKSLIGVSTLSNSPFAEEIVKSILVTGGFMSQSDDIKTINPRFHIISMTNLSSWYGKYVV